MSGIYIKGMEMPKSGNWKTIRIYCDGTCAEPNWQGDCKYMQGCEAVPVPEHGDLIDKDAFERRCMFDPAVEDMQDVIYALRDYPTIIPADEEGEE